MIPLVPIGTHFAYLYMRIRVFYCSTENVYIRRGLRVVVLEYRAMRRPQIVERQLSESTFFLYASQVVNNQLNNKRSEPKIR